MFSKILPRITVVLLLSLSALFLFLFNQPTAAFSSATHVVISEVQTDGTTANDEFVELYNPTNAPVNLDGWRLTKRSGSGGSPANLVANMSGTISAHGFFLVVHPLYDGSVVPDLTYSASSSAIAVNNNVVTLYSDAGTTVVDLVGMGTATIFEGSGAAPNPETDGSIERKPGESDPLAGNGTDTDNNANDFVTRNVAEPQNTSSSTEIELEPTESPTPSPIPTEEPTPTPTIEPTASPTTTPSTTPIPTASPSPTSNPLPTPKLLFDRNGLACWIDYVPIQVRFWHTFILRRIICGRG